MKRGWMIALLLAFVLLFTGCSGGTEQVDASEEAVFEEWRTDVVTVSYMDVSFSVPGEATIIGDVSGHNDRGGGKEPIVPGDGVAPEFLACGIQQIDQR